MKLKVCSVFILILLWHGALAQVRISGKVVDHVAQQPLAYVEVFDLRTGDMKLSGIDGGFELWLERGKTHRIMVYMTGYEIEEFSLRPDTDSSILIRLRPIAGDLSEVLIQQKKENDFALRQLRPVQGTAIYSGKKSEVVLMDLKVGNIASNNARQIYSQVVGLTIVENGDAGLQLNIGGRGLDPNRTSNFNTRQNGYDISADVLGYPESYYTPPAEALQEIQIVRGAASLQFGTQFGGLINFKFREPNPNKKLEWNSRQTLGSFGLFTSFNSLSGTKGKWSYNTWVNFKKGNGFRPNSAFESLNYYGMIRFIANHRLSFKAEYTHLDYLARQAGGLTDSKFLEDPFFSNRNRNWFHVNWNLLAARMDYRISTSTTFSLSANALDAGRDALGFRGDPVRPERNPVTEPDDTSLVRDLIRGTFKNASIEARLLQRYSLMGIRSTGLVGIKYYKAKNSSLQGAGSTGAEADFRFRNTLYPSYPNQSDFLFPNENLACFAEQILHLTENLSVTPGARMEYIHTQSEGAYTLVRFDNAGNEIFRADTTDNRNLKRRFLLGGVGMSYTFKPTLEGYANFSENYRSVTFSDIRVVNPSFLIDPAIQDESGYTADVGFRGKIKNSATFDLSAYLMRYNDRIGIVLVSDGPNKGDRMRKNVGDARITGFESFVDWNVLSGVQRDSLQTKLNVFVNLAITNSRYIHSEEATIVGREVEFVPRWNLKSGIRFGFRDLTGSLQYTYLSGQYTDAENSAVAYEGDSREGIIGEIPAYSVWDFSMAYKFRYMRVEGGVNNVLNRSYFNRRATGYPGPGIIPAEPRSGYITLGWIIGK